MITRGVITTLAAAATGSVVAQPIITVTQESTPNAGDFASHTFGTIRAWSTDLSPDAFYNFGSCHYRGSAVTPLEGRVQTFFADTSKGLTLMQVNDAPGGGGTSAQYRMELWPRIAGETFRLYTPGGWYWWYCQNSAWRRDEWDTGTGGSCDFGFARWPLVGGWTLDVQFAKNHDGCTPNLHHNVPPINGMFDWLVHSETGTPLALALEVNRRVRFVPCNAPSISSDIVVSVGQSAELVITPGGSGPFTYQWRKNGVQLPGRTSRTLPFAAVTCADTGAYDCVVTNGCGIVTTKATHLATCPADLNCDGFVSGDDFDEYAVLFINGDAAADFNNDGFVNGDDFDGFTAAFAAGC